VTLGGDGFTSLCWPATGAARLVADNNLESSAPRLCGFSFCPARKAFDPFLVIAVERAGILAPQFLEEDISAQPAGIVAVPMACFLINMIPGYSRLVCSRTFESLRLVHNFSVALTSELAMNPHEDSVPFGSREPIIFGVRNPF
jgi:hypothetical protein